MILTFISVNGKMTILLAIILSFGKSRFFFTHSLLICHKSSTFSSVFFIFKDIIMEHDTKAKSTRKDK